MKKIYIKLTLINVINIIFWVVIAICSEILYNIELKKYIFIPTLIVMLVINNIAIKRLKKIKIDKQTL